MSEHQTTEADAVIAQLRALDAAMLGQTTGDDEAITAACESAIEEIERLRAALSEIEVQSSDEASRIRATQALDGIR